MKKFLLAIAVLFSAAGLFAQMDLDNGYNYNSMFISWDSSLKEAQVSGIKLTLLDSSKFSTFYEDFKSGVDAYLVTPAPKNVERLVMYFAKGQLFACVEYADFSDSEVQSRYGSIVDNSSDFSAEYWISSRNGKVSGFKKGSKFVLFNLADVSAYTYFANDIPSVAKDLDSSGSADIFVEDKKTASSSTKLPMLWTSSKTYYDFDEYTEYVFMLDGPVDSRSFILFGVLIYDSGETLYSTCFGWRDYDYSERKIYYKGDDDVEIEANRKEYKSRKDMHGDSAYAIYFPETEMRQFTKVLYNNDFVRIKYAKRQYRFVTAGLSREIAKYPELSKLVSDQWLDK